MYNYQPSNWYWVIGGSSTQVYSSASMSLVSLPNSTYAAWLAAGGVPTAIDTLANLQLVFYQAGILAVVLTSTGIPALNGSYAITPTAQDDINAVVTYIMLNGTFPGGGTTLPWIDAVGSAHIFPNVAAFKNFATAIANFVAQFQLYVDSNGSIGSMPSNALTIA